MRLFMMMILVSAFSIGSIACEKKPKTTGEKIESAADEFGEGVDNAADELQGKSKLEQAGESVSETAEEAGDKIKEGADKTGDKIEEAVE